MKRETEQLILQKYQKKKKSEYQKFDNLEEISKCLETCVCMLIHSVASDSL